MAVQDVVVPRDSRCRLKPSMFLEAVRCLDEALVARLNKLGQNKRDELTGSRRRLAQPKTTAVHSSNIDKTTVNIHVELLNVNSIDTINDNYTAELLVQSRWREPKLDSRIKDADHDDEIDWDQYWNPRLLIDNVCGEQSDIANMTVIRDYKTGQATVCESRRIKGRFFELMELYKFPFDVQRLTVTLVSELDCSDVRLVADPLNPCAVNVNDFSAEQEWKLGTDIRTWNSAKIKATNSDQKRRYPMFSASVKVSRRPQFFMWNIITMMFLTCSLSFATFTCDLAKPHFRLQLTFLLLLTTVTFKFAVSKLLPKISYLTFLDKYVLGSLIIQFAICIWHALVGSVIQHSTLPAAAAVTSSYHMTSQATPANNYTVVMTSSSSVSPTVSASGSAHGSAATQTAITADYIALGSLGGFYVVFQIVFLILIGTNTQKFSGQIDDDDEKEQLGNRSVITT